MTNCWKLKGSPLNSFQMHEIIIPNPTFLTLHCTHLQFVSEFSNFTTYFNHYNLYFFLAYMPFGLPKKLSPKLQELFQAKACQALHDVSFDMWQSKCDTILKKCQQQSYLSKLMLSWWCNFPPQWTVDIQCTFPLDEYHPGKYTDPRGNSGVVHSISINMLRVPEKVCSTNGAPSNKFCFEKGTYIYIIYIWHKF